MYLYMPLVFLQHEGGGGGEGGWYILTPNGGVYHKPLAGVVSICRPNDITPPSGVVCVCVQTNRHHNHLIIMSVCPVL